VILRIQTSSFNFRVPKDTPVHVSGQRVHEPENPANMGEANDTYMTDKGETAAGGPVQEAFESSEILVVEINQQNVSQEEQQSIVQSVAFRPQGEQFSEIAAESTMEQLTELLDPISQLRVRLLPVQVVAIAAPWRSLWVKENCYGT
jgi:hypothetical protein